MYYKKIFLITLISGTFAMNSAASEAHHTGSLKALLAYIHNLNPNHLYNSMHTIMTQITHEGVMTSKSMLLHALEESCALINDNKSNIDAKELETLVQAIDMHADQLKDAPEQINIDDVDLPIFRASPVFDNLYIQGKLLASGPVIIQGSSTVGGNLSVQSNAHLLGSLNVTGLTTLNEVGINGDLVVTGSIISVSSVIITSTTDFTLISANGTGACLVFETEGGTEQGSICAPSDGSLGLNVSTGNGGVINVGLTSGTDTTNINIGTTGSGSSIIAIGNGQDDILTIGDVSINTVGNGTTAIGTGVAAGAVQIGRTGGTTNIAGTTGITGDTTITGALTQMTGVVSIGADAADNNISIGTGDGGAGRTITIGDATNTLALVGITGVTGALTQTAGTVSIGADAATNAIDIGTGTTGGGRTITIGATGNTTNLNGTVTFGTQLITSGSVTLDGGGNATITFGATYGAAPFVFVLDTTNTAHAVTVNTVNTTGATISGTAGDDVAWVAIGIPV